MENKIDWKNLGTKAAIRGVTVTAELFTDVVTELNKLSQRLQEQVPNDASVETGSAAESRDQYQTKS